MFIFARTYELYVQKIYVHGSKISKCIIKNWFYTLYITLYNRIWKTLECDIQNFTDSQTLNVHIQLHSILKKIIDGHYIYNLKNSAWLK